ncbi:hypothetical protein PRIPAC_77282 [Pristionchus pacificus]|uniref:Uncharacterized protein n=1 Tax=Pristionchus pacificus TaxID=54126 RepID=A0A2A6CP24_PRIPA|nr:hypothetical protein PRIPAC_77282 [Pristionchus pacificus]|eukprot:PDM79944.1 hypothetical protein PRIPAC_32523 [Pristionchus pacificus]
MNTTSKTTTILMLVISVASAAATDLTTIGYHSPCDTMKCAAGSFCAIHNSQAQCFSSVAAKCADDAVGKCGSGTTCVQFRLGATCMSEEKACEATECCTGHFCAVRNGRPACLRGAGARCANFPGFCPPKTTCVQFKNGATCMRNERACAAVDCGKGFVCSVEDGKPKCLEVPSVTTQFSS